MKEQKRSWLKPETPTPQGQPHEQTGVAPTLIVHRYQLADELNSNADTDVTISINVVGFPLSLKHENNNH